MTLGQKIRTEREKYHVSQRELHRAVGLTQAQMWKIEQDKIIPNVFTLQRIAQFLGTTVDALLPPLEAQKDDAA